MVAARIPQTGINGIVNEGMSFGGKVKSKATKSGMRRMRVRRAFIVCICVFGALCKMAKYLFC